MRPTLWTTAALAALGLYLAIPAAATASRMEEATAMPASETSAKEQAIPLRSDSTTFHKIDVDGVGVFYREAGPKDAPTVVLLHGYPSSSRQWNTLIPLLADRWHVIAPDYPGFGQSDAPAPEHYAYTFDHLAVTMSDLLKKLGVGRYVLFMQDYGGPVGFRMAMADPQAVVALIAQNANAYDEGLGAKWKTIAGYWSDPVANPQVLDAFMSLEAAKQRHIGDSKALARFDPVSWDDEFIKLSRPGQRAIQGALLYDYRTNVASYPTWQAWMRQHRPPTLVMWGGLDPSFVTPGGLAYRRDLPDAEINVLNAGHFALDEATDEIANLTRAFLARLPAAAR